MWVMDMHLLSNKGFLLVDSLITVFITSLLCVMCYSIYQSIVAYDDGYRTYQEESNENLEYIYNSLWQCQECIIDESD